MLYDRIGFSELVNYEKRVSQEGEFFRGRLR